MNQWAAFCMGLLAAWLLALEPAATAKAAGRWANTDYPSAEFFPILPWDPLTGWDGKLAHAILSLVTTELLPPCN